MGAFTGHRGVVFIEQGGSGLREHGGLGRQGCEGGR